MALEPVDWTRIRHSSLLIRTYSLAVEEFDIYRYLDPKSLSHARCPARMHRQPPLALFAAIPLESKHCLWSQLQIVRRTSLSNDMGYKLQHRCHSLSRRRCTASSRRFGLWIRMEMLDILVRIHSRRIFRQIHDMDLEGLMATPCQPTGDARAPVSPAAFSRRREDLWRRHCDFTVSGLVAAFIV